MAYFGNSILILNSLWLLAIADRDWSRHIENSTDYEDASTDVDELSDATAFDFNDSNVFVTITENKLVEYDCSRTNKSIDDKSLPKLDRAIRVDAVTIIDCKPPAGLYKEALAALNISGLRRLNLEFQYCTDSNSFNNFAPHNFENFDELKTLEITCMASEIEYLDLAFLRPLENLKHLTLSGMKIPPMPPWNRIPSIELHDTGPLRHLQPWGGCDYLETLFITSWGAAKLPNGWLADCPRLVSAYFGDFVDLTNLPLRMLNSTSLRTLEIISWILFELPEDLFSHTQNLRVLNLTTNGLRNISRSMFSSVSLLEELNLSSNGFQINFLPELSPLKHLRSLTLDSCLRLSNNVCMWPSEDNENNVINPWPLLPALEHLSLQGTGTEIICKTWSETLPSLKLLNLTNVQLTELRYEDIQFIQSNNLKVDLRSSMFEAIVYEESDYEEVLRDLHPSNSSATLWFDSPLDCDCRWYWFARVLQERPGHFQIPDLECRLQRGKSSDPVPLKAISPESFICKMICELGCECYRRTHDNTVQVNCTGSGLTHVPRLPHLSEIHMANNRIEELDVNFFTETLEYMDIQYNQLSMIKPKTVSMMFSQPSTRYRLEGNPIICACNNSVFIDALQRHHNQIIDYDNVTCVHGELIKYVSTSILCLKERTPVIAGVFGSIALLFLIALAVYYRHRHQVHIVLYAWGWCSCCVTENELDKDKIYDVFVSYAYDDEAFVLDELLPGLEKKPHAFKVCVHYRDWMAGEWIPAQIAQSVEDSRRTVIILSKNFLSSIWSLLEFRTAHSQAIKDGRARLIVVLLEDVMNHTMMDDELRAYLTSNTYIRWGDPRFWDKLRYALPHRKRDDRRLQVAGEEVMRLMRPSDPPVRLRDELPMETLCIEAAPEIE